MLWTAPVLILGAVLAMFVGVYRLTGTEARIESRLDSVPIPLNPRAPRPSLKGQVSGMVNQRLARSGMADRIAIDLARANMKLTVSEYILVNVGLIFTAFLLGLLFTRQLMPGVALGALVSQLPRFYLKRLQSARLKAFQDQLADVLNLLVSSLKAGYGLLHAMEMVVQEMPNPSAEEFSRVVRETALGFSLSEAMEHLVRRVDSDDLDLVVTAVSVQHEVGGNLATILDTISTTIRERMRIKGEINVMTTQQRMTGFVLSGMPFLLGTIIMVINPDYMMRLFEPRWLFIPGAAVGMMVMGNMVIQKILQQDF